MFEKAGKPTFAAIVPGWNFIVILEITGRPWKQVFRLLIPFYNFYFFFRLLVELSKAFGKRGTGYYLLSIFLSPLYFPYLGFSPEVKYEGIDYKP